jgi:hypothetical protein
MRPSREANGTVLDALARATRRLPAEGSLVDSLFALECAARGGRATQPLVERYRSSLRRARWYVDDDWKPDAPHLAVLAQAAATLAALDEDIPEEWSVRLSDALKVFGDRRTRYGPANDPHLLATLLRGLTAVRRPPPAWLVERLDDALARATTATGAAELAEAASRHNATAAYASTAASTAFNGRFREDADGPFARWWLAHRLADDGPRQDPDAAAAARMQALASTEPAGARAASMAVEVTGAAVGDLLIAPTAEVAEARWRRTRRERVAHALWRGAFLSVLCVLGLVNVTRLAQAFSTVLGSEPAITKSVLIAILVTTAGFVISGAANAVSATFCAGRSPPRPVFAVEAIASAAAGVLAGASN